jgi:myo-inositol-1(or 4)-monophosphatase
MQGKKPEMTQAEAQGTRRYLEAAMAAAREGGSILMEEFSRPVHISYKGDVDLVTQADRRSEDAVVARLRREFPEHAIAAEEGGGREAASEFRWHVDPLDGTTNFAHHLPQFAVSIGLERAGELLVGVVFNPANGEMFSAERGQGARLNGQPIHVSRVDRLERSLLGTGFPTHKRTESPNIHFYWQFTLASHGIRRVGAAALDLCMVACGRLDGFWEFGLKAWDTAAGTLIVREAGGRVTDFEGRLFVPGDRVCLATNGLIHEEMCRKAAAIAAGTKLEPLPKVSL